MAGDVRDVEFAVTASDRTGSALAASERRFEESQKRIDRINKEHADRRQKDLDESAAKIGRRLESVFGDISPKIAQSLSRGFASAGQAAGPVLAGAIAGSLPLLGATISGAVIGAAGLGGVVGGLYLAAKDARVKGAADAMGKSFSDRLTKATEAYFVKPSIDAIGQFGKALDSIDVGGILKASAQYLPMLTTGVSKFVTKIGDGIENMVKKAGPVIREISIGIGDIGDTLGGFFTEMSKNADAAALAIRTAFGLVNVTLKLTGGLITSLTKVFGFMAEVGAFGTQMQTRFIAMKLSSEQATAAVDESAAAVDNVGKATQEAAAPLTSFSERMNNAATAGRGLFDATTDAGEAVDRVTKSLKENGRSLDANTEKGRANRAALSGLAQALLGKYNAETVANGESKKSNAIAASNRETFIRLATQFGKTRTQAEQMATSFGLIPAKKNSDFYLNTHDAAGRAKAAQDAINSIKGKTVTVRVSVTGTERLNALGHRIGGYSSSSQTWAATDGKAVSRTAPPTPVNLTSNLNVALDGKPFREMAVSAAEGVLNTARWRNRQGVR